MKQTMTLLWKSWRDVWWLVAVGLGAIFLPSWTEAVTDGHVPNMSMGLVVVVGPVIALLLGIVLTCRDLDEPLLSFWSSRPIGVRRFLSAKFIVGVLAVICVSVLPVVLEQFFECVSKRGRILPLIHGGGDTFSDLRWFKAQAWPYFIPHPWAQQLPVHLLIFACSFGLGCLVRRVVPAALMACAAAILVFFGPIIVPGFGIFDSLHWMMSERAFQHPAVSQLRENPNVGLGLDWVRLFGSPIFVHKAFVGFVAAMLAVTGLVFAASVAAVRRNVRWALDQKAIMWSLGIVLLLLTFGASRQLGSDFAAEKVLTFDKTRGERSNVTIGACIRDGKGVVAQFDGNMKEPPMTISIRRFDETSPSLVSEPLFSTDLGIGEAYQNSSSFFPVVLSPNHPEHAFTIDARFDIQKTQPKGATSRRVAILKKVELVVLDLAASASRGEIGRVDLSPWFAHPTPTALSGHSLIVALPRLAAEGNRLVVSGLASDKPVIAMEVFDISRPDAPKHIGSVPGTQVWHADPNTTYSVPVHRLDLLVDGRGPARPDSEDVVIEVPQIDGLAPRQQLRVLLDLDLADAAVMEGDLLVKSWSPTSKGEMAVYRLEPETSGSTISSEKNKLRAKRIGSYQASLLQVAMDRVPYFLAMQDGILYGRFNSLTRGIEAWDLRRPDSIRHLGSYIIPDASYWSLTLSPLPRHRLLIGSDAMHIVPVNAD